MTPAADPGEYPCAASHLLHSARTPDVTGPTGNRGIRSAYGRAIGDLFVTDLTSRHFRV